MEKELFAPVKAFFEAQGFLCDGEVGDIDLYMEKDGVCAAAELKERLDFRAVQQAALRQRLTDVVYIAVWMPKDLRTRSYRDRLYLLKRLGIGLLGVSKKTGSVGVLNEPAVSELSSFQRRDLKKRQALSAEFRKRTLKTNTGGVHSEKLMTGYREDALLVLSALRDEGGEASPGDVRKKSGVEKAASILRDDHYGWFDHASRGVYRISGEGVKALSEFRDALLILEKEKKTEDEDHNQV